jgi:hypothetical protein
MTMTAEQAKALLRHTADAIVETVEEAGDRGAPGGVLYAALMGQGMTLDLFERIMARLVEVGQLTKRGDCYYAR